MGLPTSGCGNNGSGFVGGGNVFLPSGYRHQVYCDSSSTGAMSGCGATIGSASDMAVMVESKNKLQARGREGGGADGGVGGRGGKGG